MNAILQHDNMGETSLLAPFFLAGELVEAADVTHRSRDLGVSFTTPALDLERVARPRSEPPPAAGLKVAEIIDFLAEVGSRLTLDNPQLQRALEIALPLATVPRNVLAHAYDTLGQVFSREWLETTINADVGAAALDDWQPVTGRDGRTCLVKACPPRLVHVLAGNSPLVAAMTIAHGALVKGVHLIKMPSNDVFTSVAILRTMAEVGPGHPVTRSFSAAYWKGGDEAVENVLYRPNFFDKIVVWGGEAAVRHVQKYVGPGFQMVSWDPKTSISMIGREAFESEETLARVAALAATDAAAMNQDGCISSRYQFIEGSVEDADRFCALLAKELGVERQFNSARGFPTPSDIRAEVDVMRLLDPEFGVWGDYSGSGLVVRSDEPVSFFPDCRTVNVVPVAALADAVRFANVATQTVGVFPPHRKVELRDRLADFGAQIVCCLGEAMGVAPGMPHDGCYELNRVVRWVADRGPMIAA